MVHLSIPPEKRPDPNDEKFKAECFANGGKITICNYSNADTEMRKKAVAIIKKMKIADIVRIAGVDKNWAARIKSGEETVSLGVANKILEVFDTENDKI